MDLKSSRLLRASCEGRLGPEGISGVVSSVIDGDGDASLRCYNAAASIVECPHTPSFRGSDGLLVSEPLARFVFPNAVLRAPNIQIQKTGAENTDQANADLPAFDLERWLDRW